MNDLISRAALLKECERRQETDPMEDGRGWSDHFLNNAQKPSTEWMCVEVMIENMPTIDAIPIEWLKWLMLSREDDIDKDELAWILREWESERREQEGR